MQAPDHNQVQDLVRRVLLPAVIGGAGGGALSAYTSAQANPQGETPQERRHRILKNALIGAALGGGAGAAVPQGWHMLTEPYVGSPEPTDLLQRGSNFIARNAGTGLAAGAAVGGLRSLRNRDRANAFKHLFDNSGMKNEGQLRAYLSGSQGNRNTFIDSLIRRDKLKGIDAHKGRFGWNEVLSQAGFKGMDIPTMAGMGGRKPFSAPSWAADPRTNNVLNALREHLEESAALPESMSYLSPTRLMAKLVGKAPLGVDMTPVAQRYAEDILRPATRGLAGGRMGWGTRLGLAGAGVLGAKSVWDSMSGN
jgi:hypothetical protein